MILLSLQLLPRRLVLPLLLFSLFSSNHLSQIHSGMPSPNHFVISQKSFSIIPSPNCHCYQHQHHHQQQQQQQQQQLLLLLYSILRIHSPSPSHSRQSHSHQKSKLVFSKKIHSFNAFNQSIKYSLLKSHPMPST